MPLRLRRQFLSGPFRVRRGFRLTHVHRPAHWQRNRPEHRAVFPCRVGIIRALLFSERPEMWVVDSRALLPFPVFRLPVTGFAVSTGLYEFHVLAVRHWKHVNRKFRHGYRLFAEFVVPSEWMGKRIRRTADI